MQVTFSHLHAESDSVTTFYFTPERQLKYTAGQFVELTLPHEHTDSRGDSRWFTLSSSPTQDSLSITTEFADLHGSSFKNAMKRLQPGDT
jgi:ferredoxin-NADP reductase